MRARFTVDGSDALERRLADICDETAARVLQIVPRSSLHALVLGGGYGRGEGGVLFSAEKDEPYNDLEFYLLLRGSDLIAPRRYRKAIAGVTEELSRCAGLEVELKLLSLRKLEHSDVSMFYYDLVSGHRTIEGDDSWLSRCDHHRAAHRIPLHEATRLLMNRCSGLLFAQERLGRERLTAEDTDFIGRNFAKAKLAFGDVILTLRGQYHWSCRERQKRLKKMAAQQGGENLASLVLLHEQGVEFKLHPVRTQRGVDELRSELDFLKEVGRDLWLQLETRRLGKKFSSVQDYASDRGSKCPETSPLKNRLINARTFGPYGLKNATYPRERLLRALPLLLWAHPSDPTIAQIKKDLRTEAVAWRDFIPVYQSLWRIFN